MGDPNASPPPNWQQTFNHYTHPSLSDRSTRSPPIYSRDFAYANNSPVLRRYPMRAPGAASSINAATSAKTFASYV